MIRVKRCFVCGRFLPLSDRHPIVETYFGKTKKCLHVLCATRLHLNLERDILKGREVWDDTRKTTRNRYYEREFVKLLWSYIRNELGYNYLGFKIINLELLRSHWQGCWFLHGQIVFNGSIFQFNLRIESLGEYFSYVNYKPSPYMKVEYDYIPAMKDLASSLIKNGITLSKRILKSSAEDMLKLASS